MKATAFAVVIVVSCLAPRGAMAQESGLDGLRAAAKNSPADPSAALSLGTALRRAGLLTPALAELRRGVAVSGGRVDVVSKLHWEVARALIDRRDFAPAMTECKVLGTLPGQAAEGHACAAEAHLLWQRSTEALAEVALALAKDPRNVDAKLAEAKAYDFAIDAGKSEASYRAALSLQESSVEAHLGLGRLLAKNGRRDEATSELRRAVALDPDGPDALYELGLVLAPGAESLSLLEHATRERQAFGDAWIALGEQQLASGHVAEARRAGDEALRADASTVKPYLLLGRVALVDNRPDDAIHAGEAALRLVANSAPAHLLIADGDARRGDIDPALEDYQAAWGLDHSDPTPLVHASQACHAAGRDTSAQAFGAKAAQEFPEVGTRVGGPG